MIFNDMTSQYFNWLRETVCGRWEPRNLSFHKLLAFLFQQDFIPSCEMDASRAEGWARPALPIRSGKKYSVCSVKQCNKRNAM